MLNHQFPHFCTVHPSSCQDDTLCVCSQVKRVEHSVRGGLPTQTWGAPGRWNGPAHRVRDSICIYLIWQLVLHSLLTCYYMNILSLFWCFLELLLPMLHLCVCVCGIAEAIYLSWEMEDYFASPNPSDMVYTLFCLAVFEKQFSLI